MLSKSVRCPRLMQWRKRASPDALKCWKGRELTSPEWQQTAMYPSPAACPRTTHTLVINMMNGICPSGWSKSWQTRLSKRVARSWPHGYSPSPTTYGGLLQHVMAVSRCCGKSGSQCQCHVSNGHKWSGNSLFHQCCHRHISSSEAKKICWIKPGTPAHLALEEVVLNNKLLKDLVTDFCHTGKIEVYHSLMLKSCSKREHFSYMYKVMVARTQLAALDNKANTGRK